MRASAIAPLMASLLFGTAAPGQPLLETVEVIETTPLGRAALDTDRFASNVRTATAEELRDRRALDLTAFMERSFASVFVNEAQSNPLQPDLQYRGFVGSPLLGLPQGIAVYQDAVRVNELFGDTVNWALIPQSAIDTVHLIPGSNPLFGLNTLGGAVAIRTKDGFAHQGSAAELVAGSFSRIGLEAETGGSANDRFSYFASGSYLEEDGWRDFSPTQAAHFFAKLAWRLRRTRVDASLTLADTDLVGNGAAPVELLEMDRRRIFTRPDRTRNELTLLSLAIDHTLSAGTALTGSVYLRGSDIDTYNGDDSDFAACADTPEFVCGEEDGRLALAANGHPIPATEAVAGAAINRTRTGQDGAGFGLQFTRTTDPGGRDHLFVAGLTYDGGDTGFRSNTELGALDATRRAVPSGIFVGESLTRLETDTAAAGLYLSTALSVSDALTLTVSGRYHRTEVELDDRLGTALNGRHAFDRLNPGLGLSYRRDADTTFYASYGESNRVPSPVELTCADEDDPCRLPNAFLADPPLEQVVASTYELGARGAWTRGSWSASAFSTTNANDILFISAGSLTNEGFFDNVGRTRRKGLELSIDARRNRRLGWFANYAYLSATFRERFSVPSPNHPGAVGGEVFIEPGDRLPLIPKHLLKVGGRVLLHEDLSIGGDLFVSSDRYLRGDEGNLGEKLDAYWTLNLRAEYRLRGGASLFLVIDNLLDREYETFGLFGEAGGVLGDRFENPRFYSPGAPRAAWLGVRLAFQPANRAAASTPFTQPAAAASRARSRYRPWQ